MEKKQILKILFEVHEQYLPKEVITHEVSELYSIMAQRIVNVIDDDLTMPTKEEFTHNGELIQPHYDNAMKAWNSYQKLFGEQQ